MSGQRVRPTIQFTAARRVLPRGIVPVMVPCPDGATGDALLIAAWRAEQFNKPVRRHLARARKLIASLPRPVRRTAIGLSDHDLETLRCLGCAGDIEAGLVAAWLTVGVKPPLRKKSNRSCWDTKLVERRMKATTVAA